MGECTGNHDDFVLMRDRVMNMIVQQTIECQRSEVEVGLKMKFLDPRAIEEGSIVYGSWSVEGGCGVCMTGGWITQ